MERIKALRERAGLRQDDLALKIGVDRSTVAKWESAGFFPRTDKLPQIADALHCTIDAIFGREPADA